MKVDALYVNDQHAAGQLSADSEPLHQFWIDGNRGAAIDAQRLTNTGNEKKQCDARIAHDIAKAI